MNMRTLLDKLLGSADWGIHPDDHKRPGADAPVRVMPAPSRLYLPLSQHSGAPARPIVLVGQKVKKGECLAEAQGMVSAPVHAPTSGTVLAVADVTAPHPSGLAMPAIMLEPDGLDEWIELKGCDDPFALSPAEINKKVAAAGVVGMGGGTFPSAVKLTGANRAGIHTVIINGGECEPYLSCDDVLMRTQAAGIVAGVRLIVHASGAKRALIGIEDNKPEAIAAMQAAAAGYDTVRVCPVPARFPMGFDKQMVKTLTGIEVPADGRSFDAGVLVNNVGTALAVWQAVAEMTRKYFGTDGIRGTVGQPPITPDFVLRLAHAVGRVLRRREERPTVLIGKDTRISGYMLEGALESGFNSAGVDVVLLGPLPTPGVAYLTRAQRASLGVVISASHNAYPDNGIKFFSAQGTKLPDAWEQQVEAALAEPPHVGRFGLLGPGAPAR